MPSHTEERVIKKTCSGCAHTAPVKSAHSEQERQLPGSGTVQVASGRVEPWGSAAEEQV